MQDVPAIDATVRLAAGGDEAAFAALVAEHHASMARVAYVICGDAEAARDAVQAAWAIAWRRLSSLRQPEQVRAWLAAIAANEARPAVRRTHRATVVELTAALEQQGGGDPADAIRVVDLERALLGIKAGDRALLALRFVAGLDSGEIAQHLGVSASGVRSRLDRLLDRLRAELGPVEGSRL